MKAQNGKRNASNILFKEIPFHVSLNCLNYCVFGALLLNMETGANRLIFQCIMYKYLWLHNKILFNNFLKNNQYLERIKIKDP